MSIKEELLSKKVGMFHTPKTFREIEDWIDAHSAGEKAHLCTAAMMTWNYAMDYAASKIEAEKEKEGEE